MADTQSENAHHVSMVSHAEEDAEWAMNPLCHGPRKRATQLPRVGAAKILIRARRRGRAGSPAFAGHDNFGMVQGATTSTS
jgi:hypothetical protein